MTEVYRICPKCGANVARNARHCSGCGFDMDTGSIVERNSLPATVGKAALPVLAGLAGLVVRAGWKLLRNQLAEMANQQTLDATVRSSQPTRSPQTPKQPPASRSSSSSQQRRTIRIRSSWAIGDANGVWRQGTEEHIIEFDDE